jgi:hypothetical protein
MNIQIISEARSALLSQPTIPMSPGCQTESGNILCLGAAIVDAANRLRGVSDMERSLARIRMITGTSPASILQEAEIAGIDLHFCRDAIVHNDYLENSQRKAGVLEWLDKNSTN